MKNMLLKRTGYSPLIGLISIILLLTACNRYLDEKPVKTKVVPSTLADIQALLDNYGIMNASSPVLANLVCDDYYLETATYNSRPEADRLNHIWEKNTTFPASWTRPYQGIIYYANVALDFCAKLKVNREDQPLKEQIVASALFYRAFAFLQLAQLYCRPYSESAATDAGIVLRLTSAIEATTIRATVQETYYQILEDLKTAVHQLPITSAYLTRPTKAAAYGVLARTYLSMRDYTNAAYYAGLCLNEYNTLMDYNDLVPLQNPPIAWLNKETIYYSYTLSMATLSNTRAIIDSNLYHSYDNNDLRKQVFFKKIKENAYGFQGSYNGTYAPYSSFDGIATDEIFLIKAEAEAKTTGAAEALKTLNTFLRKRWQTGTYTDYLPTSDDAALMLIRQERRKELLYRGLRWSDLRRYNLEGANITPKRIINGVEYTLPPNDLRWVMLIPAETTNYSSIKQNPR